MESMKVKKDGKVIIIHDCLKDRYISLGYKEVEEKKSADVSARSDSDKKK